MMGVLLGMGVALLPERFRRRWFPGWHGDLRTSAILSGSTQIVVAIALLIVRYPRFVSDQMTQLYSSGVALAVAEKGGDTAVSGMAIIFLLGYILLPVSILLIYFAFEGAVRLVASVATGEVVGTLPLVLIDSGWKKWEAYSIEKNEGPRVPDLLSSGAVERGEYDLAVASCRAKAGWDHLMTISYGDELYEVAGYVEGEPPRKHVYLLRRAPLHKVVRGIDYYHPEEVMKPDNRHSRAGSEE